jgi:hypothetical protein
MKRKLIAAGTLCAVLVFGAFVGCENNTPSCADENSCNNTNDGNYCGRSECDAYYNLVNGSKCDCP